MEVSMKTLEKYNEEMENIRLIGLESTDLAGVLCDQCPTEMILTQPDVILTSYPPKQTVKCPNCGYRGYKEV